MTYPTIDPYLQRHELYLEKVINHAAIPAARLREATLYSLFPGGKRIRPVLVYLTGKCLDVAPAILDVIAAAIELTHCYSLVHDDLPAMDDDDFRRGKASSHKAFDEATAILVGDGLQALALELLLTELPALVHPELLIAVCKQLVHASGVSGMVSGQSLDLSEMRKSSLTQEQLREIHALKTGKLISACVEMVLAVCPTVSDDISHALRSFARDLGLVFQMQDDYLDFYADKAVLGKGRSSDLANHKTTFATLLTRVELETAIAGLFRSAQESLSPYSGADALVELTKWLEARSRF